MKINKIYIGSDHAAFEAKEYLKKFISSSEYFKDVDIIDCGTSSSDRCNYPEIVFNVIKGMDNVKNNFLNSSQNLEDSGIFGILLCGSGIGVSMVANKFKNIRAALCRTKEEARLSREHNNANILCLGARINTAKELSSICFEFFQHQFMGERHTIRLKMFQSLGELHVP